MKGLFDVVVKALLATGVIVLSVLQCNSKPDLVYIDSKKLVLGYKGMEKAKVAFEAKASLLKSKLDTLRNELEPIIKEYESNKTKFSGDERKKTENAIGFRQQQYLNYEQTVTEQLKKEDEALTTEVMGRVNEYLREYGRNKGYRIILASTLYGNIAYANEDTNITDDVLKGLNEAYK